ncbi:MULTISPECIES: response regulator [Myxococcus]|nr:MULTISPECIES: response regulator transcription factor [Myxococcus]QPM83105.1 response regulator transcription factor [Myxococcus xanthus]QQR47977.1 response regulator transcription factor [Myxococcus xanthus]QVW65411.1 response regulator transcription factor [Myxococcus xanthus DZ2]QZZ51403.1 Transcriptional regulatory protein DegU [Myxococcus xanthus]UEO01522.1 response regulator transcription factor [Myxococcus xanthus DZ2]
MDPTRIFVVEDQPQLLKNLVKVLATFPELEVVGTSQEGEAAVEDIVQLRPQLVLLDLELPGINGIQVTQRVKRRAPEVEILILTSFDDETKVYEAIQAGASGYLVKRVGPEKIRSGIQEVMEGGTVLEPIIAKRFWNYFQSVQAKSTQAEKKLENPWALTPLEFEVLRYVAKGLSNAEVGHVMTLERRTVRTHLSHIYRKMGVNSHVEAVVMALRAGVVDL